MALHKTIESLEKKISEHQKEYQINVEHKKILDCKMEILSARVKLGEAELQSLRDENVRLKNELHSYTGLSVEDVKKFRDEITDLRLKNKYLTEQIQASKTQQSQIMGNDDDLRSENEILRDKLCLIQSKWNDFIQELNRIGASVKD
jgi:hypothetical protein